MSISPSLGGKSVPFLHRPGRKTKTKSLPKILTKNFWPAWFFCRNNLKFSNLPTAFINFDALSLVTHCFNVLMPCLWSRSMSKLTMPKNFDCRNFLTVEILAKKLENMFFFRAQLVLFSTFRGSDWLNSLLLQSNKKHQRLVHVCFFWWIALTLRLLFGWVATFSGFFANFVSFRNTLLNNYISEPSKAIQHWFRRHRRRTSKNTMLKKFSETFGPTWFL